MLALLIAIAEDGRYFNNPGDIAVSDVRVLLEDSNKRGGVCFLLQNYKLAGTLLDLGLRVACMPVEGTGEASGTAQCLPGNIDCCS